MIAFDHNPGGPVVSGIHGVYGRCPKNIRWEMRCLSDWPICSPSIYGGSMDSRLRQQRNSLSKRAKAKSAQERERKGRASREKGKYGEEAGEGLREEGGRLEAREEA
jgi:hypothetical protein